METNMKALMIVTNAGFADDIINAAREVGVRGATILNARGEGAHHETIFGITVDTEKDLILSIVDEVIAKKAMEVIKERFGLKTSAHCICFTMPVDKIIGINIDP